jgi:hypothetical protein
MTACCRASATVIQRAQVVVDVMREMAVHLRCKLTLATGAVE